MAISQTNIDDYLDSVRLELSKYAYKLCTKHQVGQKPAFSKELKFMLLQSFVNIANVYLLEWDDTTNNGFTVSEFNDIQRHINKISNSFHWLDLS